MLRSHGVTKDRIYAVLKDLRGTQRITDQNPEEKYQALQRYCRDLTEEARKGKLDPVIGRDDEIRRVMRSCRGARRTTPWSSARPAWKQPSWKGWRKGSCRATYRKH